MSNQHYYLTAALLLVACGPANVAGPGFATEPWQPDHNITPDSVPCTVPSCDTDSPANYDPAGCCAGVQPSSDTDDNACPSGEYPNNWTCTTSGTCVHGGCSTDADCGHPHLQCLDPTEVSGTVKFCLQPCDATPNDTCNFDNSAMKCTGVSVQQTDYCRQDPFP